ncbi:MAG: hypothetical protein ABIP35_12390 [Ginsengibacter sp.]
MKSFATVFLLLTITFSSVSAQDFNANISRYAQDYAQERLYIHFDKSSYAPGDSIWFKVYVMEQVMPADKSKTVYLDWSDEKGKLLYRTSSPLAEGTTYGQFAVPAKYAGQYVHVKAYTRWMLNFDTAFLYNKDIKILSNKPNLALAKNKITPEITFFPEGGDAIEGVVNKIAFKANDQYGRPLLIKGNVQSTKGTNVDSLNIIHDGMGYFYLNPTEGETYIAKWKVAGTTQEYTTPIPDIKKMGLAMQVTQVKNNKAFSIVGSDEFTKSGSQFHVLGTMYQQPVFTITREFKDGAIQGIVPTDALPSGILTITVFDNKWTPLAERITYINHEEYVFKPDFEVMHWGLNKRAKNIIEIKVPDSLVASLSVSVTDLEIDADSSDNIISHFLLTGDLKGKVYNPAHYFINNSDSISRQLDLVMLTHGWRRFNWENVVKGNFPKIDYPRDSTYMTISGKIYGASSVQLRDAGSIILLYSQDKRPSEIFTVPIAADGSFNDPTRIFFDTSKIYYQLPKKKGLDDASVQFMQNKMGPLTGNSFASGAYDNRSSDTSGNARHFKLSAATLNELEFFGGKLLDAVTIKKRTKTPMQLLDEKYASGLFQGGDAMQFDLRTDTRALSARSIFSYLQGMVAGLQINETQNPPSVIWRGGAPQFFIDESPATTDLISSISVSDVAYIKVLRPPFIGAVGGGANGAISIYTKRGDDVESKPGEGLANNTVTGYTAIRQFYSPNYTVEIRDDKKDLRTTLYWNPEVLTRPGNNSVILSFYNNDVSNGFRVIIEGMTKDGRLAHYQTTLE